MGRYKGNGDRVIVLGHGAGAGQKSRFMTLLAKGFAARGITAITFDFPYMAKGRRLPDKAPVLEAAFEKIVAGEGSVFIGGKSMGGRIATMIATRVEVRGVVCFGYPLHPRDQPEKLRVLHLPAVKAPMFFVQGTRDELGSADELARHLRGLSGSPCCGSTPTTP